MLTDADWLCQEDPVWIGLESLMLKQNDTETGFGADPAVGSAFMTKKPTLIPAIRLFRVDSAY
jgi:hypothetical protein